MRRLFMSVPKVSPATPSEGQGDPPPLDVAAVARARAYMQDPDPSPVTEVVRDLLAVYDNLAARYAWLAAKVADGEES